MNKDPFKEYIMESEPSRREKGYAWHTAIGLQAVDGLKTSEYLVRTAVRNIEGEISFEEADALLQTYYEENPASDESLGFDVTNDIFAENAWYFRNALVRANYNDLKNGICETTKFLEIFLRNLLLNEDHPLHNRTMHISSEFEESKKLSIDTEKADIDSQKANIDIGKAYIEDAFTAKTASHIRKLQGNLKEQVVFGRFDVQRILGLKPTRSSELLREMADRGIIEPVSGHGKGRYRFRQREE